VIWISSKNQLRNPKHHVKTGSGFVAGNREVKP